MPLVIYRRQKEILDFLKMYISQHGTAPTLREIADAMNVRSLATIHEHLEALTRKNLIRRSSGNARGIQIVEDDVYNSKEMSEIVLPLVGYIAAGRPIEAVENPLATVAVPSDFLDSKHRYYVLQVKGTSMIDDGILDGDQVIIQSQNSAHNGEIVVAILDSGLTTLKRYYKESNRVRLEPANSEMAPIFARDVEIRGVVVGLMRRFNKRSFVG